MTKKKSCLLVVDASVAKSAGEAEHPMSSACRVYLEAIREICHRVALSPELRKEWDTHMSRFTSKWRRSMAARKKPLRDVVPQEGVLNLAGYAGQARKAIEKDMCLLEAAVSADRIIVTRDDKLKIALKQCPQGVDLLETVRFINPMTEDVGILRGL